MSKSKPKITDADIIDIIIKDRMELQMLQRARAESRLAQYKERYKSLLLKLVATTARGRGLMKLYPKATAEHMSTYKGYKITLAYNRHSSTGDELSADIVISAANGRRAERLHGAIRNLEQELRDTPISDKIAWKRDLFRDILKDDTKALAAFRKALVAAVKAAYKNLPDHRVRRLKYITGIPQPSMRKAAPR